MLPRQMGMPVLETAPGLSAHLEETSDLYENKPYRHGDRGLKGEKWGNAHPRRSLVV
jgi:hypothetical protein